MSERTLPVYIDTRKAFNSRLAVSGTVSLASLPRLRERLSSDQGAIEVELSFHRTDRGLRLISGQVNGEVGVTCQRCLEPVRVQIHDQVQLALIEHEAEAARLEPDLDPWVSEDYRLQLAPLVEEQLLLCLPIVSYHEDGNCIERLEYEPQVIEDSSAEPAESPFAVLKTLKED